jgi:hypothetical protein
VIEYLDRNGYTQNNVARALNELPVAEFAELRKRLAVSVGDTVKAICNRNGITFVKGFEYDLQV